MTETFADVANQLREAKEKRRKLIEDGLDGRSQTWLCEKTGMNTTRLYHCISGLLEFTQDEIDAINKTLGTDFKLG